MLAFFAFVQTGQRSRRGSQTSHEQRCLQGRNNMHELRELQPLHTVIIINFLCFSSSHTSSTPLFSSVSSCTTSCNNSSSFSIFTSQQDSASSASLLKKPKGVLSLTCSNALFNDTTMASLSCAALCHAWFSVSNLLKKSSSSIVLLAACAISSSFCLSKNNVFDSILFSTTANCCFLCSCNTNLNLSFCFHKKKKKANQWDIIKCTKIYTNYEELH